MENGLEERTNVCAMTNRGTVTIVQRRNVGALVCHDGGVRAVGKSIVVGFEVLIDKAC